MTSRPNGADGDGHAGTGSVRPFRARGFVCVRTQGFTLGFLRLPRWGRGGPPPDVGGYELEGRGTASGRRRLRIGGEGDRLRTLAATEGVGVQKWVMCFMKEMSGDWWV